MDRNKQNVTRRKGYVRRWVYIVGILPPKERVVGGSCEPSKQGASWLIDLEYDRFKTHICIKQKTLEATYKQPIHFYTPYTINAKIGGKLMDR